MDLLGPITMMMTRLEHIYEILDRAICNESWIAPNPTAAVEPHTTPLLFKTSAMSLELLN